MKNVKKLLKIEEIHRRNIKGENVGVVIMDTGISEHPDLNGRIIKFKDFVNNKQEKYDDEGHGTHVSGIVAGDGKLSRGMYSGIAPKSEIISLKVLDERGVGREDDVIEGIWWIIDNGKYYNIRVVNISFGTINRNDENQRLIDAVEILWNQGYVIVAAAGNNGPGYGTVSIPGSSKKIITVGALNDNIKMIVNGKITKNYSGRGPTNECVQKPDILAPGNNIYSCNSKWQTGYSYVAKSGTSMSTPIVSGVVSLMLSKNPKLTNVECKKILGKTAIDMKMDRNRQGWGLINPIKTLMFTFHD